MASPMVQASGRGHAEKPKEHKKKFESMSIRNASNGGHIVEHRFESGNGVYHEPELHVFAAGPEMVKHVMDMHGVKEAEMIAHLKGDNKEEPGGESEEDKGKGEHGSKAEDKEEE